MEPLIKTSAWSDREISALKADAIIVGVYEGGTPQKALVLCGKAVVQEVTRILKERWMRGKSGETLVLPFSVQRISRLVLIGLGKKKNITEEALRKVGGEMTLLCNKSNITSAVSLLSMNRHGRVRQRSVLKPLAEGVMLAAYRFDHYQSQEKKEEADTKPSLKQMEFVVGEAQVKSAETDLHAVQCATKGVFFARDLANQPGNALTPEILARHAREMAESLPVKTTVLAEKSLKKEQMNGILAVGQGSVHPPKLIVMKYAQGGEMAPIVLVGKAITFDSGGISLKPGAKMDEMKFDMCGGAAVLGTMRAVAMLEMPINLIGIVPAAENMPSGSAQRPGDVIQTAKGLFVEVLNTDAEGRLILADALHYAARFKPEAIIDLATLTGACVVALGSHASGLMGNDQRLVQSLKKAGEKSGERAWPLPLYSEYQEAIRSTVADIKNIGNREAGTITAAMFLSRFVEKKQPWAHLDIAGTAWDMEGKRSYVPKGAVGIGVRLLCHFLEKYRQKQSA